ncbi:MAG: hypothetical protein MJZ36_00025 [Bacteroidaceae bacterium]|nr:hypothetical protein [Bacteroidaceae bacterium]
MKKLILPVVAISILSFSSCHTKNTSTPSDTSDADSAAISEVAVDAKYGSPDLQFKDLKGNVKECSIATYYCDEQGNVADENNKVNEECFVFDENGMIDLQSPKLNWRLLDPIVKRDADRYIVEVKWYISDYDTYVKEQFRYNADHTICQHINSGIESDDAETYTYDDNGTLIQSVSKGAGEGSVYRNTITYTILATDAHDNWVRRLQKNVCESGPDDGSETYDESFVEYSLESRTITYWK